MNRLRNILSLPSLHDWKPFGRVVRCMITKPASALKLSFLAWLARELRIEKACDAGPTGAQFDPSAVLMPEGAVENYTGYDDRIAVGAHSYIRGRLLTYGHGGRIRIGQWCYVGLRSEIWSMESIAVGDRVLISHDVNIHDGTAHSLNAEERYKHFRHIIEKGHPKSLEDLPGVISEPVIIEDDVWISFGVTILKGVRIGAGSVIAANCMVTKDVPPGMIYRSEVKPILTPLRPRSE
jgi:acetyltransferase-like isoleucine patch superfamily enzyme